MRISVSIDTIRRMVPGVESRALGYPVRPELVAVLVTNALPAVGVLALGWDAAALVLLYWLELGILCVLALVRATFAGRPAELAPDGLIVGVLARRPTSVSVPRSDIGIQLSTLPVLAVAIPFVTLAWFTTGAVTVGVVGPDELPPETVESVALAAVAILITETGRTTLEYFYRGEYQNHSAQTAIQGAFLRVCALFFGSLLVVMAVGIGSDAIATDEPISAIDPGLIGVPVLIAIVLVKFGFDLGDLYRDRLAAYDESTDVLLGWAYEPPTTEPVDTDLSGDVQRVRPASRGRLLGGIPNVRRRPSAMFLGVFILVVAGLFASGQVWSVVALLFATAIAVPFVLSSIDHWLRYAAIEYRTDGDAIVAYDRLFRQALWRVEPWDETALRIERDRLDDQLDTVTVVIELRDDESLRLPYLSDSDLILETFDRRAERSSE